MPSKTALTTLLAATLALGAPAFAQDAATDDATAGDAMSDDAMSDDAMSDDAMSDDAMADDAMADDAMSDDAMADDAMADDAMADDAMTDDAMAAAGTPDLTSVSGAIEAATAAGLIEILASGDAYTAFVPTNDALVPVQDAATDLMADEAGLATLIQGYVVEGNVMAADAMTLVTDGGGTATVDSIAGTPLTLAMEGDVLTVNGAAVTTPDVMLGNVVIHVIDGAFLPES